MALSVGWDDDNRYYQGLNLLTLEMAYNNARLIARPEAKWLLDSVVNKPKSAYSSHRNSLTESGSAHEN